ncbi:histidine kinase [Smaragdicoccus niigatensis]|uniref:sensor histidine kinase n=1 Tax=Smaragdicoccus niigatensis TaxID=359359 RepID=UPI0003780FAD|nr:histidine kinase [Smaragdicoccus niigatensis]
MGIDDTQVDGILDRVYRRFGWRMVAALPPLTWLIPGGLSWFGIYYTGVGTLALNASQSSELAKLLIVQLATGVLLSFGQSVVECRPLRRYERGEIGPDEAWRAVVRRPRKLLIGNFVIAGGVITPSSLVIFSRFTELSPTYLGYFLIIGAGVSLYMLGVTSFSAPVVFRPVLRAIRSELDGPPPEGSGMLIYGKLVFIVPALAIAMAINGGAAAIAPQGDLRTALVTLTVIAVVAALAIVPITMFFAQSVNLPIHDLIDGTKRVKVGDYSTPVPELSADELGELARSFNEAMEGLSERQQLAREVRASRTRIVAAADESRKRIERNIHDGAQQRLVALALDLKLLEDMAPTMSSEEVVATVRQAGDAVKGALIELRELARGLHPQILTSDGLGPALSQLATRSKLPVRVDAPTQRYSEPVETAAYFVVAEALANVAKYAQAESAHVTVEARNGSLRVEVADDGIGGATLGAGTGLAGLADRVAALDGRLTIDSPIGAGTTVRAEIPVRG